MVATDAIGMGLNLPIKNLYFYQHTKFDGKQARPLHPWEVRQVAGRAGRYLQFETGFVGGCNPVTHDHIARSLTASFDPAYFSQAIAGPTVEHIVTIAKLLETNSISRVLEFFLSTVTFSSVNLQMGQLSDLVVNAHAVDLHAPQRPLEEKWTLACAPVPTNTRCYRERACYTKILAGLNSQETVPLGHVFTHDALSTDELSKLEITVIELTIYIWFAFRFPDILPDREAAETVRGTANTRITEIISARASLPLFAPRTYGDDEPYYYEEHADRGDYWE
jgi:ATP-dependent RNA helicase SUPV3L1/SUV3